MSCIADFCRTHGILDKAIVEMCKLDNDEAAKREICRIANKAKPAFLKTSTGRASGCKTGRCKTDEKHLHDDIQKLRQLVVFTIIRKRWRSSRLELAF